MTMTTLDDIRYNDQGLVPVVVQQYDSGEVLMMAWMNAETVRLTMVEGRTVFWSRSRQQIWRKGETSGHTQRLVSLDADCDGDTLLARVDQIGAACHTGTRTCFTGRRLWSEIEES
ncbi:MULTISPECIES: phosphoribosyl-AMP cyclohydrolase [unclassified Pseudoclavibacter]|uniref:phosphoribosyl-AMP cyclohydrolase n=1 Tax=unclassified Pseudoclavibacter TaxID=2615177 RepID=UPI00130164F1|nr:MULTISPECIES: phosphoribosyl-AMP cyclohydrolase [unclassified Pseudoclavibacter]KAB1646398.1 phosphoribosyl-AMP cyclohydrolase [Pseudoclavibacter sp. CFCC 14310]KAB1663442.1 phosphoribosyl-AMP cyclohydrolase [Pseudoclavibacter sp. CFCC 13611]